MERVTDVPGGFAQSAERDRVNDYDSFAGAYSAENVMLIVRGLLG